MYIHDRSTHNDILFDITITSDDKGVSCYSDVEHCKSGLSCSFEKLKFNAGFEQDDGSILSIDRATIQSIEISVQDGYLQIEESKQWSHHAWAGKTGAQNFYNFSRFSELAWRMQ